MTEARRIEWFRKVFPEELKGLSDAEVTQAFRAAGEFIEVEFNNDFDKKLGFAPGARLRGEGPSR
jgi:hypothetical protein